MSINYKDTDPAETNEWIESISDSLEHHGYERTRHLLESLINFAQKNGARLPFNTSTPYLNTILPNQQPDYPGDLEIEKNIMSAVRWNAMSLVNRANKEIDGIGGHISTYQSASTLYEVGFNHIFKGPDHPEGQDLIYIQGHSSPGIYARAFLEGRLTEKQIFNFRQELSDGGGLSSYPHPYLMPDFWQFATVSMGLGPIMAIYQARFMRYLIDRGLSDKTNRKVFAFLGDGEMDEPESLGAITLASREKLDNLVFVINCNLQRLDGPVRGNSKVIQELEGAFRGAGWNVIKVIWGSEWDELIEKDTTGLLLKRFEELVDGDLLKYVVEGGQYIRKHFFGKYPELLKMVAHLSDDELEKMKPGGHDPVKVYSAYHDALNTKGKPSVILARTVKGYGLGGTTEGRNITHQKKKLEKEAITHFKEELGINLNDEQLSGSKLFTFDKSSKETEYISKVYKKRGGPIPARVDNSPKLSVPKIEIFDELLSGSSDRSISTTMAFIRLLTILTKDKSIGKNIVPIVPDEARTFGMDPLFRQIGIYAHSGQLYEPVDSDQFLYYKEEKNGQILEEGINEGGSISSFNASGSSYANHGIKTIPFYIFYSMFGYQRIWDFIWAGADMRVRGFLLGGTAGRTTLNGEGLQHQDGHSHVAAAATPNTKAYDCAFSYEIATVVHQGLIEMCEEDKDVIYYLTLENENYVHPPMPNDATDGIIKGLYRFMSETDPEVSLFGSGPLMGEVIEANKLLKEDWDIRSDIWSVTSYSEIRKDAESTSRWNMNHPNENPKASFLNSTISNNEIPIVAVSDYIKMVPNQISPYIKNPFYVLGTDGFGRSDTRESLRKLFEIDRYYIVLNSLKALVDQGKIEKSVIEKAMDKYNIDSEKPDPINS